MNEILFYKLRENSGLTSSLATQIAREIGRQIVAGIYAIGTLIEGEATLMHRYRVSRSAIRDAIKILVGKGLLEVRRGIGTRVRARNQWGLLDDDVLAWHQSVPPTADFLRQLNDFRMIIEPKAARWAATRGTHEGHSMINIAQKKMHGKQVSIQDFVQADALFHRSILRASNNEWLRAMEGIIYSALISSIRLTNSDPRKNRTSMLFHRAVANAIFARNGIQAEIQMEKLLADARKRLENMLDKIAANTQTV